jgi:hypothetical protein
VSGKSIIKLIVSGDISGAKKALKELNGSAEESGGALSKFSGLASGAFAGAGAAAAAFVGSAVSGALNYEEELDRLNGSLDNAGLHHQNYAGAIKDTIKANEKFGTNEDQTVSLLNQGVIATQSFTKAQALLKTAQNVAAGTGKDLGTVYSALIKVTQGNSKAAKQLGIDIAVPKGGAEATKLALDKLHTAQQHLIDIQGKVHDGQLKGKDASDAEKKALDNVAAAQTNLKNVTSSTTDTMEVINKRYANDAVNESKTRIGQIKAEEAKWHDFKNQFGDDVISLTVVGVNAFDKFGHAVDDVTNKVENFLNLSATGSSGHKSGKNMFGIPIVPKLPSWLGGGRAAGGPVNAGGAYTVGENGPETLVMGNTSGHIIPNGGGVVIHDNSKLVINGTTVTPTVINTAQARWNKRNGRA